MYERFLESEWVNGCVVTHSEEEEEEDDDEGVRTHVHYVLKAGEAGKALRCSST